MKPAHLCFVVAALAAGMMQVPTAVAQEAPRALPVDSANAAAGTAPVRLPPPSPVDRNRKLGIGDQVSLQIVEDRTAPIAVRVSDTGDLEVPYIGRVPAEGKSVATVTSDIEAALERDYYYNATVRLAIDQVNREATLSKVFISGEVRSPGAQDFYKGDRLTVGGAVLRAGSFTQWANKREIRVVRPDGSGGNKTYRVDLKAVLEDGQVEKDMEIQDGDYIIVRKRLINF